MSEKVTDKLQEKKAEVMRKKTGISSTTVVILLIIGAMAVGGFAIARTGAQAGKQVNTPKKVDRVSISGPIDYTQERVDMKKVSFETKGKWLTLKVSDIKKYKINTDQK
ncbi:MAG TPA: hypothetical protein ENI11_05455 [Actinobacteria bacterium]|nr:hypothetical protein [Actinomycetota bacterium]